MRTHVLFTVAFCFLFVSRIFSQGCNLLCNGGFDDPTAVTSTGLLTSVNCWSTTASDGRMEIWASGFGSVASYSGIQFVELNATQAATMYQDFPVQSGVTYTVGFAHRGRAGTDTMQVFVGPSGGSYTSLGKYADGTSGWGYYTAAFTPTSNTTFRILFTPIYWSGGNVAIGNFIDNISVIGPYTFTVSANSVTICPGNSATLQAQGATSYLWSTTSTSASIVVSPTTTTSYTVAGTVSGCTQSVVASVSVSPVLNFSVSGPVAQCSGATSSLAANGALSYTWNPGNGSGPLYAVSPTVTTQYTVNGVGLGGCGNTKLITLIVNPNPTVTVLIPTVSACPGSVTILNASGAAGYSWQPTGGSGSVNSVSPTINTTYTVTGTTTAGCAGTATASIFTKPVPVITFNTYSITCASLGSATVLATGGLGPFNYTWIPTAQTGSIANNLNPNTYTATLFDTGTGCTTNSTSVFTSLVPLTGTLNNTSSLTCNGVNVGMGVFTNLAGGSPNQNYVWTDGTNTFTSQPVTTLGAGNWSVTVTDALTACQINSVFTITQPPPLVLNLSSSAFTSCAQTSVNLSSTLSGGTPGYTQQWTLGSQQTILSPNSLNTAVTQNLAGSYTYTLSAYDSYSCVIQKTIAVNFIQNPTLTVNSVSICPLETGTLNVNGATTYTWVSPTLSLTGNYFTDTPLTTTEYTIVGTAQSCTSSVTASIVVKPLPSPFTLGTTTLCEGQNFSMGAYGGVEFNWTGPQAFTSSSQNININPATPNISGIYQTTVTGANSCTATTSTSVTVYPTPTISVQGSTVCTNQNLNLQANSFIGSTYLWKGPMSFSSTLQNPSIVFPSVSSTGNYTVVVTSPVSCTNVASVQASVVAVPSPSISSNGTVCLSQTLNFFASGGNGGIYTWSGPLGFNSANTNTSVTNASLGNAGMYTLSVVLGPCVNFVTKTVIVNPLPSFTLSSNIPCENDDLQLYCGGINNAVGYQWIGPMTSTQQNPVFSNASQAMAGVYTLSIIDVNSCINSNTQTVSIRPNPTLTPISTTVCLNQAATLKVQGAQSYLWTGPGTYTSGYADALIPVAGSSVPVIYTVVGIAANQCTAATIATLSTFKLPVPYIQVAPSTSVCLKETLSLQAGGALVYSWDGPGGLSMIGQNVAFEAQNLSYGGTYTLNAIDNNGCRNYTTTTITVIDLPHGYLVSDKMKACAPFDADFTFSSPSPVKTKWYFNANAITSTSFSLHFQLPGQYTLSGAFLDTLTGCSNTESFVVEAYGQPGADFTFSPEKPTEISEEVVFTNKSIGENLNCVWYLFDNNGPAFYTQNATYNFDEPGIYPIVLEVEDAHGCKDTVVKNVKVDAEFTFYVPNAFTPNNDDRNDIFLPIVRGVKSYNLQVFDRWGERVFMTSDLANGWDGNYKGKVSQDGTYVWKIQVSTISGDEKFHTGYILLYR